MRTHEFDWRVRTIGTTGPVQDPAVIAHHRKAVLPATAFPHPTTQIVDIGPMIPSAGVLLELVIPLGQQVRGGLNGRSTLIFATSDPGVTEVVRLIAKENELPLYLSASAAPEDVERAEPAGKLTEAERRTLSELRNVGGFARASQLAQSLNIEPSAAHNRLESLAKKGYLFRFRRPRSVGDLYVDPRTRPGSLPPPDEPPAPMRAALQSAGIESDPYDRGPLQLRGAAAERVAEIVRRRGKGH